MIIDVFKGTVTPRDWGIVAAIIGVAGLLCVLFYFFLYTSQQEALARVEQDLESIQTELRQAREIRDAFDELQVEAEKYSTLVDLFEQRLPERREIPQLLRQFEAIGSELGLRVQLESMPPTTDATKETIPYRVIARGTFHQIVSFINLLERDERYLKISEIDIGEEQAGVSEATFVLSTFRFIQTDGRSAR